MKLNYTKEQIEARYKKTNLDIQITDDWLAMYTEIERITAQLKEAERLMSLIWRANDGSDKEACDAYKAWKEKKK